MLEKFYITTTLPYINADPHIGFAMEIIRTDIMARFRRAQGQEVLFNTGTDEHGQKVYEKAKELGIDVEEYCNQQVAKWLDLKEALNLSFDSFIRTNDPHHIAVAQEFWRRALANDYIYKKFYKIKYCVGCELEKTDSELVNGKCPLHPNRELEIIEEENYFFRYSSFQEKLLEFYKTNPEFVVPAKRFNEVKKFVEMGLEDFSISRVKNKMPWGVDVPDDPEQVMYVWFDALVNYISAIGWPDDMEKFNNWWPVIQVAGKDNLRPQSAMWQTMLMSVGLPNSKKIYINSFITSGGQKMSKSLGNVISPLEMIAKFGIDGTRYLLAALPAFGEDTDITWDNLTEKYNADLANGLGNLVARVSNLLEKYNLNIDMASGREDLKARFFEQIELFKIDEAIKIVWEEFRKADEVLTREQPWKLTNHEQIKNILEPVVRDIIAGAELLSVVMPAVSEKIITVFSAVKIRKGESLFPRIAN